jgi:hypothetical protein
MSIKPPEQCQNFDSAQQKASAFIFFKQKKAPMLAASIGALG